MRHKAQVQARVRKLDYRWDSKKDVCLMCGKHWLRSCSSHSLPDNLAALSLIREEDNR